MQAPSSTFRRAIRVNDLAWWCCILVLAVRMSPVEATTVVPPNDPAEFSRRSVLVVLARALGDQVTGTWPALSTETRFQSLEVLKGNLSVGETFVLTVPGGERDGQGWLVAGRPRFQAGDSYLLFLHPGKHGLWQPLSSSYGILHEERAIDGKAALLSPLAEVRGLAVLPREANVFEPFRAYRKDLLLRHLENVIAGRERWSASSVLAPEALKEAPEVAARPASCAFYAVDGQPIRWNVFDRLQPVSIHAEAAGDSSLPGGGFAELEGAIADWNAVNGSSISIQYAGKKSLSLGCSSKGIDTPPLGTNIVIFNDPCSDIPDLVDCAGSTAVAGPYYSTTTHTFDGTAWKTIIGWFVIVNNGAGCFGSDNYKTLLAHELGHGLGFDHVQDPEALMNAFCCHKANSTDLTCAKYLYPGPEKPQPVQETLIVPVVVDAAATSGTARYSSELTLTNKGPASVTATVVFTPSTAEGGPAASGSVRLDAGSQRVFPDVLAWLRSQVARSGGLSTATQVGTLRIEVDGATQPGLVHASARTTASTADPFPAGAAGLAYPAASPEAYGQTTATVFGLRSTEGDRSNLAVFNPGFVPVTVSVTAYAGDGSGRSAQIAVVTLPSYGWTQFNRVLDGAGFKSGWVTTVRTSPSGQFGVYGVVNDNSTNDGSFIEPARPPASGNTLTVPVLVETETFQSELVLANRGEREAELQLQYVESGDPESPVTSVATFYLPARTQLIVPDAIGFLRDRGLVAETASGIHIGTLRIRVSGVALSAIFAGARTSSVSAAGGRFGLFAPCVYQGDEAAAQAAVLGLRSDEANRSNLAVINASPEGGSSVTLEIRTFDGDLSGLERGAARIVTLLPGEFRQLNNVLVSSGIRNGWAEIKRTAGTAPWIAYGVVNDGARPGERTGDGAYVAMVKK